MNKQNEENSNSGAVGSAAEKQKKPGMTPQAITAAMENERLGPEQLPRLWRQALKPGETALPVPMLYRWRRGIDVMYQRCETYPQHTKLAVVLSGMPYNAWRDEDVRTPAKELLHHATTEQLLQALAHGQQHPKSWWVPNDHVLSRANLEQLSRPVTEQLFWNEAMAFWVTKPDDEYDMCRRWRHVNEHIQNQLFDDDDAWTVFLGIVGVGDNIGDTAELAKAIAQNPSEEQRTRPV